VAGDRDPTAAVEAFVADHHARVVRAVALYCGDPGAAEDVVQDALGRAWERLERGEDIRALDRWVVTVAMNLVRSRFRRVRREQLVATVVDASRAGADSMADTVDLARALGRLPDRQRASVVLHYFLDLTVDAAAEAMGVSAGTVKTSLFRARQSLADGLDGRA
jgi:RNA polymerase sigma-70 factor, ECF subfamily